MNYKNTVNRIIVEYSPLSSEKTVNPDLETRLLAICENNFIAKLYQTLELKDPRKAIEHLLCDNWQLIMQTPFCYTNQPDSFITKIALQLACFLHKDDNRKTVYQYLMPTLTYVKDEILYCAESVDDHPLNGVVLSSVGDSLIPVSILSYLSHDGNAGVDKLINPYTGCALTNDEIERLRTHSSTTRQLFDIFQLITDKKRENNSLGGAIQRLIEALYRGGQHGRNQGSEGNAGPDALAGVHNFMTYWNLLPLLKKNEFETCHSRSNEKESLGSVIAIFTKEDKQSLDCVEALATQLESILANNREYLFSGDSISPQYLNHQFKVFDQLKKELPQHSEGKDSHSYLNDSLLNLIKPWRYLESFSDLINLYDITSSSVHEMIYDNTSKFLNTHIKDILDLNATLQSLPTPLCKKFISSNIPLLQKFITSGSEFESICSFLNEDKIAALFSGLENDLDSIVRTGLDFCLISKKLNEQQKSLLYLKFKDKLASMLFSFAQLSQIEATLNDKNFKQLCLQIKPRFNIVFSNGQQLHIFLRNLNESRRTIFIRTHFDSFAGCIKCYKGLTSVLNLLDPTMGGNLLSQVNLSSILKNIFQLKDFLRKLPECLKTDFINKNMALIRRIAHTNSLQNKIRQQVSEEAFAQLFPGHSYPTSNTLFSHPSCEDSDLLIESKTTKSLG